MERLIFVFVFIFFSLFNVYAQNPEWIIYTTESGLLDDNVHDIAIDDNGNTWIGTSGGIAIFDGTNWTAYNTSNSGLCGNWVHYITIDSTGDKWISTATGLANFDGTNWTVYNTSNSILPINYITDLAFEGYGNLWIGTSQGLVVYNKALVVSVEEGQNLSIPNNYTIYQNYPNPFKSSTTIQFELTETSRASIKIYSFTGQLIKSLSNSQEWMSGSHSVIWDGTNENNKPAPSGVYIYQIQAGNNSQTKKCMLAR